MFNVEYKKVKKSSIGLIIGLVFIIGMMIVFILENDSYNKILLNYNRVTISNEKKEIIEDINGKKFEKITFVYKVNGKEYYIDNNYGTDNLKTVLIFYKKDSPQTSTYASFSIFIPLFGHAIFIICILVSMMKNHKINKKYKNLLQNGILIKNMKYKTIGYWAGSGDNKRYVNEFEVNYMLPSGTEVKLYSKPIDDKNIKNDKPYIDMIIDPNDIDIHYIDYDIERIGGIASGDYDAQSRIKGE